MRKHRQSIDPFLVVTVSALFIWVAQLGGMALMG